MKKKKNAILKQPHAGVWIVLLVAFMGELLFYTWCRVQYVNAGYALSRASKYHQQLLSLQNNLKVELARLKSPQRIEKIAKQRLGLVHPTREQFIVIP